MSNPMTLIMVVCIRREAHGACKWQGSPPPAPRACSEARLAHDLCGLTCMTCGCDTDVRTCERRTHGGRVQWGVERRRRTSGGIVRGCPGSRREGVPPLVGRSWWSPMGQQQQHMHLPNRAQGAPPTTCPACQRLAGAWTTTERGHMPISHHEYHTVLLCVHACVHALY